MKVNIDTTGSGTVTIVMSMEEARTQEASMADLLCWIRGFKCAYTGDNGPISEGALHEIHAELIDALYPGRAIPF